MNKETKQDIFLQTIIILPPKEGDWSTQVVQLLERLKQKNCLHPGVEIILDYVVRSYIQKQDKHRQRGSPVIWVIWYSMDET